MLNRNILFLHNPYTRFSNEFLHPDHLDNILAWTARGSWEPAVTAGASQVAPPLTRSLKPDQ